jgi:pimeloyl-ACP methyl ester carboxylesterase
MNQLATTDLEPSYPGAVAPERTREIVSHGVPLRLSEWGDPERPPVLLCHGMFDHGRGFDTLAPLLAERFRVVALDARGHGDSGWCDAYPWSLDVSDLMNVVRSFGRPVRVVGHSRGGGLATDAASSLGDLVSQLVNIDGFGPPPEGFGIPGVAADTRPLPARFADFLDDRRRSTRTHGASRAYAALDDLVERRRRQNPRLGHDWLRYFAFHGARHTPRGWLWKADLRAARGFGPWRAEWVGTSWCGLTVPMLAVIGSEQDTWGPLPEAVLGPRLENVRHLERATVAGAGHFVHMEQPRATADLLLAWLERS